MVVSPLPDYKHPKSKNYILFIWISLGFKNTSVTPARS